LQLKRIAPQVAKLYELLESTAYDGYEPIDVTTAESTSASSHVGSQTQPLEAPANTSLLFGDSPYHYGCSFESLLVNVRCSEEELCTALRQAFAFEFQPGHWCTFTKAFIQKVVDDILLQCTANGWPLSAVPQQDCAVELLHRYSDGIVQHVISMFRPSTTPARATNDDTCSFSFARTAALFGVRALQKLSSDARTRSATNAGSAGSSSTASKTLGTMLGPVLATYAAEDASVRADHLLKLWAEMMPEGMITEIAAPSAKLAAPDTSTDTANSGKLSRDLFRGNILCDVTASGNVMVRYLPGKELSIEPARRFKQLFAVRPRWLLADLEPYLDDLVGFGRTRDDLLLAHTRNTGQADGTRLFSAK
jgi:hypothetical protein